MQEEKKQLIFVCTGKNVLKTWHFNLTMAAWYATSKVSRTSAKRKKKLVCRRKNQFLGFKIASAYVRSIVGVNPSILFCNNSLSSVVKPRAYSTNVRPFVKSFHKKMEHRTSTGNSPLRISPSSSMGGLINGERKKPFLIGVAGGTASGKVNTVGPE